MRKKSKFISLVFLSSIMASCSCSHETQQDRLYVRGAGDSYCAVPVVGYVYPFYPTYMPLIIGSPYYGYSSYVHHVGYAPGYTGAYSYHTNTVIHTNSGNATVPRSSTYSSRSSSSSVTRGGFGSSSHSSSAS